MGENGNVTLEDKDTLKKLFVGGLPLSVTDEAFQDYFSGFGEIKDSIVIKDSNRKSRGFGFVTYDNYHSVNTVLQKRPHTFEGRDVEVKRAIPREHPSPTAHERVKKLFVGGLPKDAKEDDLKIHLDSLYGHCGVGRVSKVDFIRDKNTGDLKGFGFIELETEDMADLVVINDFRPTICGKQVELKKAQPKEGTTIRGRGGRGGRGGGRGGGGGRDYSQSQGYPSTQTSYATPYAQQYQETYPPVQYDSSYYAHTYQNLSGYTGSPYDSYSGAYLTPSTYGSRGYTGSAMRGGNTHRYRPY